MRIPGHAMNTQASMALAAGLIAIPVAAATGHPAVPRTAPALPSPRTPGLTISVTDGRAAATAGDRLTYTVSIRDTSITAAPHLKITQNPVPRPAAHIGQRQRRRHGRADRLARQPSRRRHPDLPGHRPGHPHSSPRTAPGRHRLRRAAWQQPPGHLRRPPRPATRGHRRRRAAGRTRLNPQQPSDVYRSGPGRARGRPAHADRRPPPPAAAAAGLTTRSGRSSP